MRGSLLCFQEKWRRYTLQGLTGKHGVFSGGRRNEGKPGLDGVEKARQGRVSSLGLASLHTFSRLQAGGVIPGGLVLALG